MRVEGFTHNLFNVLLLPGLPHLDHRAARPSRGRRAARPSGRSCWSASSPSWSRASSSRSSTTWGTFLHAAGPVHVLIVIAALLALDAGIARLGARLGWTRPVAWLGPTLGGLRVAAVLARPPAVVRRRARETRRPLYEELGRRMAAVGHPLDASGGPVITNFPIWMAEAQRVDVARPARRAAGRRPRPRAAAFPGTRLLVVVGDDHGDWPAVLDTDAPGAECFARVDLGPPATGRGR